MVKVTRSTLAGISLTQQKKKALKVKGVHGNVGIKAKVQAKRTAEVLSPQEVPSKKRSAFGDITNAVRTNQPRKKGKAGTIVLPTEILKHQKVEDVLSEMIPDLELLSSSSEISSSQESHESGSSQEKNSQDSDNLVCKEIIESEKEDPSASNVDDIDTDLSDPFLVSEYANEIFLNMKARETMFPLKSYMDIQKEITVSMRAILVDWLVEVQESFELYHETLYVGVKILDHFLMKCPVKRENLQLVGAASLFIASKVEERHSPCLDDFLYICDDAYKQEQFVAMERRILATLEFEINIPIPYRFLRRYARAASANVQTLTLARFILESTLHNYQFLEYKASLLASSCLYLALSMKKCGTWTPTLVHYTGYKLEELKDCVLQLNAMTSEPPKKNLMTVKNKYSHKVFHEVALIPSLDVLALDFM